MRRHIHENPELSGEEVETAAFMAANLRSFGIDVQEHVAGTTAVLGTLKGGKPGPVIALRADMDALPMTEETGLPFASNFAGKMHACGHDGHMSILLGAAEVLSQVKDDIPGTVVFICQPSEEKFACRRSQRPGCFRRPRRCRCRLRPSRLADTA